MADAQPADRPARPPSTSSAADPPKAPASPLRAPIALATAVASGLCLAAAFPSLGIWLLAPPAVAGLLLAVRNASAVRASGLGLVFGLAFFVPHLAWSGTYVGLLPWTALAVSQALFVAATAAALPSAWRAPAGPLGTALAVAGLWTAEEALRGRVPFGGFPWGRLAFSQAESPLGRLAWLGGAPLVTAAVAATGALLAVVVAEAAGSRRARRVLGTSGGATAVLLVGFAVPLDVSGTPVTVAAVQGNVPEPGLDFNAERRAVLDNHATATVDLADRAARGTVERPELVVWPENASDIDPLRNPDAAEVITRATDAVGVPVLVGAVLREPVDHLSNTSIVWGPTGSAAPGPGERYVKRHPAPFAEYIPFRSFFRVFSDKVDLVRRDFVPGERVGVLSVGPARVGDVICFEVVHDGLVRDTVRAGADLLAVQTNNATFGYTDESVQQLAASRLRAVETGRAVVHVSTVGVSALIAPDGALLQRSDHFQQQVLTGRLPLRTATTPAVHLGPIPEYLLAAAGVTLALLGARTRGGRVLARRARLPIPKGGTAT
ncbi:MAG: apolipoprotein N-acyltransferase [Actinomycetales bacterium]|nr:apolipoprotein N-acyltransferase [Actinomycetales bacterium]